MSTIRGWWEEDRVKTQKYYNEILGEWGEAPYYCEPWIVERIIRNHLNSSSMWAVFPIQDLIGIDGELRLENPHSERINVPSNPKHYWKYRLHIDLEDILKEDKFNEKLKKIILDSGRGSTTY
jgi:4-alpha-glucanotransferase